MENKAFASGLSSFDVEVARNCGRADDRVTDTAMTIETKRAFQYIFNHLNEFYTIFLKEKRH